MTRLIGVALLSLAYPGRPALAGPPVPLEGTVGRQEAASAGVTNLESRFPTVAAAAAAAQALEAEVSGGGQFHTGNARSGALTGQVRFRVRRRRHEFSTVALGNYAQATARSEDGASRTRTTAGNVQGRVRYDVYARSRVAVFTSVTARHDPFLGLDLRLRVDPGVALFAINVAKHRLWAEFGYDFLFDRRRIREGADATACPPGAGLVLDIPNAAAGLPECAAERSSMTHSTRLFVGYFNELSQHAAFSTGLEYIQGFVRLRSAALDTDGGRDRLRAWVNWDAALTTSLTDRVAFATTFTLRFDNSPLPGVRRLDTITAFNLVYRFF